MPTIIEAMEDPDLFGPWFSGPSWWGWRCVLKAIFALPMTEEEIAFFRIVADRDPPRSRVREVWIIVGRRGGKDSAASFIGAYLASSFDQFDCLRPGERASVICLGADREQAKIILNYTRAYFEQIPHLSLMVDDDGRETASSFELSNGVDVNILTSSFRAVRGRAVLAAVLDECAFWRDDTSTNPDQEIYNALRPGLASLPGSMLIGISSPYAKSGLLYKKFKEHYGKDDPNVLVIKAPTRALNPTIPQEIVDEAMADDPAAARAEWLAEFRDDVSGYLDVKLIEAAIDHGVIVRPPRKGVRYSAFSDPSGGARDSFTTAISHVEDDKSVLDCLIEIKPPFNPSEATAQIAATLKSYGITRTTGDRYGAEWIVDAFQRCGIRYEHSERDRSAIYLDCIPLFTSGRVSLLDNKKLVTQFAGLERKTSSIGKDRIDHGVGGHDDLCNAVAGALVSATSKPKSMIISDEALAASRSPGGHWRRRPPRPRPFVGSMSNFT